MSQDTAATANGTTRLRASALAGALMIPAAILAGAGCREREAAAAPPPPVPVVVRVLEPKDVVVSRSFGGSVEPIQTTSLAFKLAGTVASVHRPVGRDRDVQVGDTLSKGTVLAELDEGDLRRAKASAEARVAQLEARVATARDNLAIATRAFERYARSSGSVSESARDDADARRVTADGELASAEQALADARVKLDQANDDYANRRLVVPFDNATVAEKRIEPGERKQAHEVAFRLIDISTVHVVFGVPDTMIGEQAACAPGDRVAPGQELQVTADAFEGRTLTGTVTKIAPQADPRTRTFRTELTLSNPRLPDGQRLLRPGMIVTVRVGAQKDRQVLLLPMSAIHRGASAGEFVVYEAVAEEDREVVRTRTVAVGDVLDNQVEVLAAGSEVARGARVVISTAERLAAGVVVKSRREER
ncbi:MAG: Multidrug resistance protein MdtA [Planctomycetes bacterium]|nr:Multidrug resistance protein MdtA [Planctomycetota bacterium]